MPNFFKILPATNLFPPEATIIRITDEVLKGAAEGARADFLVTTQTWNGKPEFEVKLGPGAGGRQSEASTTNRIYNFITRGTRIRYATMTPNFLPKTVPNKIQSGRGRGGVMFISKKHPRPGIQARNFDIEIAKKWTKQLPILMSRALGAAFKQAQKSRK